MDGTFLLYPRPSAGLAELVALGNRSAGGIEQMFDANTTESIDIETLASV